MQRLHKATRMATKKKKNRRQRTYYSSYWSPLFFYYFFFCLIFEMIWMCRFQWFFRLIRHEMQWERVERSVHVRDYLAITANESIWEKKKNKQTNKYVLSREQTKKCGEYNQISVTYLLRARQRHIPKFLCRGQYARSLAYVITPQSSTG